MEGCKLNYLDLEQTPSQAVVELRPLIERAIAESLGESSFDDVLASILSGELTVWTVCDEKSGEMLAVFGTEILQHAQFKALVMRFVAGKEYQRWEALAYDTLDKLAQEYNCEIIEACGRIGLEPIAKRHGFKKVYSVFSKTVARKAS